MSNTLLKCDSRNEVGTNTCHRIRDNGHIPGVIYGHNITSHPLEFDTRDVQKLIKDFGENAMVNVSVDGNIYTAMIKEVQREAVSGEIIHLDLQQVNTTEKIHTAIPIMISGKDKLDSKAILQKQIEKVEVECYPNNIPRFVSVDVSELALGDSLRISDVEFGDELTVLNDPEEIIISLSTAREETLDDMDGTDDTEQAEPELVGSDNDDTGEEK